MSTLIFYIQRMVDIFFLPFEKIHPLWGLSAATILVTVFALIIYKYSSNQAGIHDAKDKIKANFLEVWLYIDYPSLILRAQAGIFKSGGRYLLYAIVPLLIMILPVMLFLINMEFRYHYRPLKQGETALVKIRLPGRMDEWKDRVSLNLPEGLSMAGAPVRIHQRDPDTGKEFFECDWNIRVEQEGEYHIQIQAGRDTFSPKILAGEGTPRLNPVTARGARASIAAFWHPPLERFKNPAGYVRIEIKYPNLDFPFLGWNTWWVWPFLIIMFIAAFAIRRPLRVEF